MNFSSYVISPDSKLIMTMLIYFHIINKIIILVVIITIISVNNLTSVNCLYLQPLIIALKCFVWLYLIYHSIYFNLGWIISQLQILQNYWHITTYISFKIMFNSCIFLIGLHNSTPERITNKYKNSENCKIQRLKSITKINFK